MKSKDELTAGRRPGEQSDLANSGSPAPDSVELALRDLERKRAEIDAAIASILGSRPDLKPGRKVS
jgi:hypothetical protein